MRDDIQTVLTEICQQFDKRTHYCDLQAEMMEADRYLLTGEALDKATVNTLMDELSKRFPTVTFDSGNIHILRKEQPETAIVCTNLTGFYAEPSFLAEMTSQVVNGQRLELLKSEGKWAFVYQPDGYLGWIYQPYLSEVAAPTPSHIICTPVALLSQEPDPAAPLVTRIPGGTHVATLAEQDGWCSVSLAGGLAGWLPQIDLRPLEALPVEEATRRRQMITDAAQFTGVPYLWGGTTALGIDCSGFVQLLHRLAGVPIPRDADIQYNVGNPVEPPFSPGDLLFFGSGQGHRAISHVGMSTGGWHIIHSSRLRNGVYADDVASEPWLRQIFVGARSFVGDSRAD